MTNDGRINSENLFALILRIFSLGNYFEIRIIAGMGQAPHLRNWGSDENQMEKYGSDGEAGDTFARRMYIACW